MLVSNCFAANKATCKFGCDQIDYLGHIISGQGVSMDPDKVQSIKDWYVPKNVKRYVVFWD